MSDEPAKRKPLYEQIVEDEDWLNIGTINNPDGFFVAHMPSISNKLMEAGAKMRNAMKTQQSENIDNEDHIIRTIYVHRYDLSEINQCLHLANVVLLLGSTSKQLNMTAKRISAQQPFIGQDPMTVIAGAVLYYLIVAVTAQLPDDSEQEQDIRHVWKRFTELNWMLNRECVSELQIPAPDEMVPTGQQG